MTSRVLPGENVKPFADYTTLFISRVDVNTVNKCKKLPFYNNLWGPWQSDIPVTKTAKINFITSRAVDIIRSSYYIHGVCLWCINGEPLLTTDKYAIVE